MRANSGKIIKYLIAIFLISHAVACSGTREVTDVPNCLSDSALDRAFGVERTAFVSGSELYNGYIASQRFWPVALVEIESPNADRPQRTVIYFSGGPGSNPISKSVTRLLKRLYADGRTKIYVATHSGNSFGVIEGRDRLREYGLSSVSCDARILKQIVTPELIGDGDLVIHSNSFGTLPALSFASTVDISIDKMVLQGPWLYPVSVDEVVNSGRVFDVVVDDQLVYVEQEKMRQEIESVYKDLFKLDLRSSMISNGEKIMSQIRKQACSIDNTKVLLVFAEFEDRLDVNDTIDYAKKCYDGKLRWHVALAAPHSSEFATSGARQELSAFLAD